MGFWDRLQRVLKGTSPFDAVPPEEQVVDISTDLTPTQQEVYDAVRRHPGATARELGMVDFPEDWRIPGRRLKELVNKGLIEIGDKRRNEDTKIEVLTYFPVDAFGNGAYSSRTDTFEHYFTTQM